MLDEKIFSLNTYNYSLPKELIAQYPTEKRDESRLLCYERTNDETSHHKFYELSDMLTENDVLILNNTKVLQARFNAKTESNKEVEILLVTSASPDNLTWKILAKPRKYLNDIRMLTVSVIARNEVTKQSQNRDLVSEIASSGKDLLAMTIEVIDPDTIKFNSYDDLELVLNKIGSMPLPPYIKRNENTEAQLIASQQNNDFERYQTVFAKEPGAVAAPTASLHYTDDLLNKIRNKGTEILYITLHVGPGTFLPIRTDNIREHELIPERFHIDENVWERILKAKEEKKRIIACGTTTTRSLEYAASINKLSGLNSLYITPGFKFKIVDSLITNFHLPKTSLLVLISSFIGWGNVKRIYDIAIEEKYRFFSYGDAMFIT